MDRSQRWKEIGSKTLHFSWIPHRDGRSLVVKHYIFMDPSQSRKEIGSKTLHSSWILHRDGRRLGSWIPHRDGRRLVVLVVKHYIFHGSLTEMEGDW